jgi:sugar lactone lactonase YvrE
MTAAVQTLIDGLLFPECPRWHNNELWFSDMHSETLYRLAADGSVLQTINVPGEPAGLGWLPNGDLLVVCMRKNCLYRVIDGKLLPYADLGSVHPGQSNDMVVDSQGNAWVGNFGFDIHAGAEPCTTSLAWINAEGKVSAAGDELMFPNGMVVTGDGQTLIVAESFASRLSAYTIAADGSLSNRRVWAQLGEYIPDGICIDAEGCIWVAACVNHACIRVREGGDILETVGTGEVNPFACMLGGSDGKRLFMCNALDSAPEKTRKTKSGRIDFVDVAVPAAGGEARP